MKIQILGTGCPKCSKLAANAEKAVAEAGASAEIEKVTSVQEIASFGVLFTPALVIDGDVKAAGKVPDVAQIVKWLQAAS